jgi:hypothetical protein
MLFSPLESDSSPFKFFETNKVAGGCIAMQRALPVHFESLHDDNSRSYFDQLSDYMFDQPYLKSIR